VLNYVTLKGNFASTMQSLRLQTQFRIVPNAQRAKANTGMKSDTTGTEDISNTYTSHDWSSQQQRSLFN